MFWLASLALCAATLMPGCIVQRISDNLELANEQMASINASVERVEAEIASLRSEQLTDLQVRLTVLESLHSSLVSIDSDLDSVKGSLQELDAHLASLRRTLRNIDSTIPFLRLADDEEDEEPESTEAGTEEAPDQPSSQPPDPTPPATPPLGS